MQIPGHETQMWGNAINEIALQQMHEKEDFFVGSSGVNEFDEILKLLLDANSILSTMITANNVASVEFSLPGSITDWFEFNDLYKQWQASRKKTSSIAGDITRNPFYFRMSAWDRERFHLSFLIPRMKLSFVSQIIGSRRSMPSLALIPCRQKTGAIYVKWRALG